MDMKKFERYLNGKFWFKNAKRILWNGEPIRMKSKEYREKYPNITVRSLDNFSGDDFDALPEDKKGVENLGETIIAVQDLLTPEYKSAFWKLNAGSDTFRVLGKEFVGDLAIQNYIDSSKAKRRQMSAGLSWETDLLNKAHLAIRKTAITKSGVNVFEDDEDSDELKTVEVRTSVGDYLRLMSAERLSSDPRQVLTLIPESEIDKTKLLQDVGPAIEAYGKKFYDPIFIKGEATISPRIVDGSKTYSLGDNIKLSTAQNQDEFDSFMTNLGKNLKVKLVPNVGMNIGDVDTRQRSILRNAGRSILDSLKYKLNYRKNAIQRSLEVEYSSRGSREEQMYTVLKEMGHLVCLRSFEDYEASFGKPEMIGMPNVEEYEKVQGALKNATAYLAAAQLACGFVQRSGDSQVLTQLFKMEAMKELAKIDKNNTWAVAVMGSVLANSLNNAFANGVVYEGIYESNTNGKWRKAKTFLSALFSKKTKTFEGILTKHHTAPTKEDLDAKFGPEQKFDIHNLSPEEKKQIKLLVGQFIEKKLVDTKTKDTIAYHKIDEEYQALSKQLDSETDVVKKSEIDLKMMSMLPEAGRLFVKTYLYKIPGAIDEYDEAVVSLTDVVCDDVIELLKFSPELSAKELEEAVSTVLENDKLNADTQTRVDNITLFVGKLEMTKNDRIELDKSRYADALDSFRNFDKEFEAELKTRELYNKLSNFALNAEKYEGVDAQMIEEAKKAFDDYKEMIDDFGRGKGLQLFATYIDGNDQLMKDIDSQIVSLKQEHEGKKYLELVAKEYDKGSYSYGNYQDLIKLNDYYHMAREKYERIKEVAEKLPEFENNLGLSADNRAKLTEDLTKIIKKDFAKVIDRRAKDLTDDLNRKNRKTDNELINKFGEITLKRYVDGSKEVTSGWELFLSDKAPEFASEIIDVLENHDVKIETAQEAYKAYKEIAKKESLKRPEYFVDQFCEIQDMMAAVDVANHFEKNYISTYEKIVYAGNKIQEQTGRKMEELTAIRNEAIKKGLTEENEAFAKFDKEYQKLAKKANQERVSLEAQKAAIQHYKDCVWVVNLVSNYEPESVMEQRESGLLNDMTSDEIVAYTQYYQCIEIINKGPIYDEEHQQEREQALVDILSATDMTQVNGIDFSVIDELAKDVQEQKVVKKVERKQRDWKAVAKMLEKVQKKNLSFEETIKAIENYQAGKEQTEKDKMVIKDFFTVYNYVSKLGDKAFENEKIRIAAMSEKDYGKLDKNSLDSFESLIGWLTIDEKFSGINSLSDKIHEYNMRQGSLSQSAVEINEIYFDLATKIIKQAAIDAENSKAKSGIEIARENIKEKDVNDYKDGMSGAEVMGKKLEKFMPQTIPDKDKKKDSGKKKTEKPQTFEELILKEVFKCIKDYETLDEISKIKMQLLKIVLTKEFVPAKVGEAEMITKAVIESKIGKNECIEIEKVSKELIHLIKDKVAECEEIEKLVQKGSIDGLSKDDKDLKESVLRYSKTNNSRFVLAHFVQNEEEASKIVQAVIDGAKKDANKKSVSTKASKQKSIVNHSGIEELVADTYDLLDKLMRSSITLSQKEEEEERKQRNKTDKSKREEIAKLIGVVSGKRTRNTSEKRVLDSKIVLEN